MLTIFVVLAIFQFRETTSREVKVFKRGKIELIDETQFELLQSVDHIDFQSDPDLQRKPDFDNIYDELVPHLPRFSIYKNGKNIGFNRVNFSTRKQPTWSTPHSQTRKDQYRTWGTPKLEPITKAPTRKLTKNIEPNKVTLFSAENEKKKTKKLGSVKENVSEKNEKISKSKVEASREKVSNFTETLTSIDKKNEDTVKTVIKKIKATTLSPIVFITTSLTIVEEDRSTISSKTFTHLSSTRRKLPTSTETTTLRRKSGSRLKLKTAKTSAESFVGPKIIIGVETQSLTNRHLVDREQKVKSNRFMIQPSSSENNNLIVDLTTRGASRLFTATRASKALSTTTISTTLTERLFTSIPRQNKKPQNLNIPAINAKMSKVPIKPPVIQETNQRYRYKGPTYNCRILDSERDGQPSPFNDPECKLSSPGFSIDGACKCTYEVSGRDENGCAIGYLYTCSPLALRRLAVTHKH